MSERIQDPRVRAAEWAAAANAALLLCGVSWAFGGNADWVRVPVAAAGTLGSLAVLRCLAWRSVRASVDPATLAWILPVALLNLVVLVSCTRAGLREVGGGAEYLVIPVAVPVLRPSTAGAAASLLSLWLFDTFYLAGFWIALLVRRARTIRFVLGVAVANALALALFGTLQKLTGASGLYFGRFPSPQVRFFATFVYDNHWGAFMVLMVAACAGLTIRYAFGRRGSGFLRGPGALGLAAAALMVPSVPLSGARACTVILGLLLAAAVIRGAPALTESLSMSGLPRWASAATVGLALAACAAGTWFVAGDAIASRAEAARDQLRAVAHAKGPNQRMVLYRDTLRMAAERPVFGWGMGSYPAVFLFYNSQEPHSDRIPIVYHDAHSDWLQSLAELGAVGTLLLGAAALLPLASLRGRRLPPVTQMVLLGCALVAAYAWVEFPFGNRAVVLAWWVSLFCAVQYARLREPEPAAD